MEGIRLWILSIFGAGIVTSVFRFLVSSSRVRSTVNIFLSMLVFLYTILPLEAVSSELDFNTDTVEYEYNDIYKSGYDALITEIIYDVCEENGVSILFYNIESYIDDEGYLVVESIEIQLDDETKINTINQLLMEKLNFEVTFV